MKINIFSADDRLTSSATGSCLTKMSFLPDADPGDSQVRKNHMALSWCQTTPNQDNDGMVGNQDGMQGTKGLQETT